MIMRTQNLYSFLLSHRISLTWNRSSQCHEHHSGHGVPEPHGAAEMWCQISDDGGEKADDADGD